MKNPIGANTGRFAEGYIPKSSHGPEPPFYFIRFLFLHFLTTTLARITHVYPSYTASVHWLCTETCARAWSLQCSLIQQFQDTVRDSKNAARLFPANSQ